MRALPWCWGVQLVVTVFPGRMARAGVHSGPGVRTPRPAPPVLVHGWVEGHARRWLARETVSAELAFLLPAVIAAVDQHTAHRGPSRW
jgi:hypothetical protein